MLSIIPGNLEYLMESASAYSNMGLYGVYNDIYIKRNYLYSSPIFWGVSYYYGHQNYGIAIFILFLVSFVYTCNKWSDIILINNRIL